MKKWKWELAGLALVVIVGCCVWWFYATKPQRAADAEYNRLVKFARRQAVEIQIIRQAAELGQIKANIQTSQAAQPKVEEKPKQE